MDKDQTTNNAMSNEQSGGIVANTVNITTPDFHLRPDIYVKFELNQSEEGVFAIVGVKNTSNKSFKLKDFILIVKVGGNEPKLYKYSGERINKFLKPGDSLELKSEKFRSYNDTITVTLSYEDMEDSEPVTFSYNEAFKEAESSEEKKHVEKIRGKDTYMQKVYEAVPSDVVIS